MTKLYNTHSQSQEILTRKYPTSQDFSFHLVQSVSKKRSHSYAFPILNYLLTYINHDVIKVPYAVIAHRFGIDKKTVLRSIKYLRKKLFIWTIRTKDPDRENRYDVLTFILPTYFYDPSFRKQFTHILSSLANPLTWMLAVSINAAGLPIRESVHGFSLRYIREEKAKPIPKKKRRLSCIIAPDNTKKVNYVNKAAFLPDAFIKSEAQALLSVPESVLKETSNEIGTESGAGCCCLNGNATCVFG